MQIELTESFDWKGHQIRWTRLGSGPPVVLCHGTPWSSAVWTETAHQLSSERTVYLWDMLGYGQSDMPDADVSLAAQGTLLTDLLGHWGPDTVDLVAHDIGGAVALRAHLLHGVAVRSLLLANVVALSPWGSPFFRLVAEHPAVFAALPANLHRALVREYVAGAGHRRMSGEALDALVTPWEGMSGQPAFYRQIAHADRRHTDEIESRYERIDVPTLIVWGTADEWIPVQQAYRLHDMIPSSRLELIEEAGHLVQMDQSEVFTAVVARWLSDQASG